MLKYIRYATILSGAITIVLGLMITMTLPREAELADGFRTPILAFEFAKSDADVRFLSDADSSGKENRDKMIKGHVWDTYFPVAYGLLLFFMLLGLGLKTKKLIWIGLPFALLAILFDLLENQTLMKIVDSLEESKSASEHFNELYIRTWMKWGAIGISILCVGIGSILQKKRILADCYSAECEGEGLKIS